MGRTSIQPAIDTSTSLVRRTSIPNFHFHSIPPFFATEKDHHLLRTILRPSSHRIQILNELQRSSAAKCLLTTVLGTNYTRSRVSLFHFAHSIPQPRTFTSSTPYSTCPWICERLEIVYLDNREGGTELLRAAELQMRIA